MLPSPVPEFAKALYPAATERTIGRPPGYTDAEIGGLPALEDHSEERFPSIRSYWRPSADDLSALNAGAYVELEVIAYRMVPVALNVVGNETLPSPDRIDVYRIGWRAAGFLRRGASDRFKPWHRPWQAEAPGQTHLNARRGLTKHAAYRKIVRAVERSNGSR